MARERRFKTSKALRTAAEEYFHSISRTVEVTEMVPTGEMDSKGHAVLEPQKVTNDRGEVIRTREFLVPPTVVGLCLYLGVHRATWARWCDHQAHPELEEKVRRTLGLPAEKRLLLYAPTFRKDKGLEAYDMDYARCVKALERRFGGEWLILAKLHPNIAEKASQLDLDPRYIVNASGYPDIQELYLACDGLVTDYSSVMFDYLITGKPCFLYVNDLAAYKADRNFTFDIDKLPFPRAEDNGQLEAILLGYDAQEQARRMEAFNREFGLRETGAAARRTVDYLEERRKKG